LEVTRFSQARLAAQPSPFSGKPLFEFLFFGNE
jgi:hypothetical protein